MILSNTFLKSQNENERNDEYSDPGAMVTLCCFIAAICKNNKKFILFLTNVHAAAIRTQKNRNVEMCANLLKNKN